MVSRTSSSSIIHENPTVVNNNKRYRLKPADISVSGLLSTRPCATDNPNAEDDFTDTDDDEESHFKHLNEPFLTKNEVVRTTRSGRVIKSRAEREQRNYTKVRGVHMHMVGVGES